MGPAGGVKSYERGASVVRLARQEELSQGGLTAVALALAVLALAAVPSAAAAAHPDLIASWPLDEGAGQVARDRSAHGLDGLLGSTPDADEADPAWVSGHDGRGALHFGRGDQVVVGDSPHLEPAELTAEAWVRKEGSPGPWAYILSKGADGCEAASYGLYSGADGGLNFYVYDGRAYRLSSPDAGRDIWDGRWHHVAGTFDGDRVRLYVDGVQVGDGNPAPGIRYGLPSGEAFYIGNYRGSCDRPFDGAIDDVRMWSRAFGPADIPQLVAGGEPPASAPSGGSTGSNGAPGGPSDPSRGGEIVLLRGVSAARTVRYRQVARRGLPIAVSVGAGNVNLRASASHRGSGIGRSSLALSRRPGLMILRVKLSRRRVVPALRRSRRLRITCSVRAQGHGRSATAKRTVILRR